jgi:hypothetical protein
LYICKEWTNNIFLHWPKAEMVYFLEIKSYLNQNFIFHWSLYISFVAAKFFIDLNMFLVIIKYWFYFSRIKFLSLFLVFIFVLTYYKYGVFLQWSNYLHTQELQFKLSNYLFKGSKFLITKINLLFIFPTFYKKNSKLLVLALERL